MEVYLQLEFQDLKSTDIIYFINIYLSNFIFLRILPYLYFIINPNFITMKMKILSCAIITAFVMFSISCSNNQGTKQTGTKDTVQTTASNNQPEVKAPKKYDIKSGIVTYKTSVMGMDNSMTLYFDDYGAKEMRETVTELKMMGTVSRKVTISLEKDGFRYNYDLENTVNKENKTSKEIKKSKVYSSGSGDMGSMASTMTAEVKKQYDYKDEGTETVAGVTGTKFSMKMGKTKMSGTLYKKIMLKTVMEMMTITATKFEENVSIPADKFELPKDYTIVETNY